MVCANCQILRDQVARLERELGHRRREGSVAALMVHLELSPMQAALMLILYESHGRVVRKDHLLEGSGIASEPSLRTTICRINSALGQETIINIQGVGYQLTHSGMAKAMAAVNPPEIQDSRGP